ncbi:hypothetical protein C8R44DRAFT_848520 [Mycena epipterygia]|nr:hypothetical protein C8R44DRAFT_848520 [Mycena epipterygia]
MDFDALPIHFRPSSSLSSVEFDRVKRKISLIHTVISKYFEDFPPHGHIVEEELLIEILKKKVWILADRDEDYCLIGDPEDYELSTHDLDMVNQMLEPDDTLLPRASETTPVMRIGMLIWLVLTSLAVKLYSPLTSAWDKRDIQGRAITLWADIFSRIMRSKQRPSEAIPTDHDYQATPDLGAWVTMQAVLFPDLQGTEVACWHFNYDDGCSLCAERFRDKLQSEAGLNRLPPLHLVALWEYFERWCDFEHGIAFAVFQQPHLFSPEILQPIEELFAQRFPEKARRTYGLHYQLDEHNSLVRPMHWPHGPSWQCVQDAIDSLARLPRWRRNPKFPPIQPLFWFALIRVLGGQYQSQDQGSRRPRLSLFAASQLGDEVLGKKLVLP